MSPRGSQQRPTLTKIDQRAPVSDVEARLQERDQRLAADNRTAAQRYLGDPPPERSALAAKEKS
jgi:hypothetical protein